MRLLRRHAWRGLLAGLLGLIPAWFGYHYLMTAGCRPNGADAGRTLQALSGNFGGLCLLQPDNQALALAGGVITGLVAGSLLAALALKAGTAARRRHDQYDGRVRWPNQIPQRVLDADRAWQQARMRAGR